jgi:aspartate racemase
MKTIGLIGGMSWESSSEYYRIINQAVARRLGGSHSCRSIMVSVDFAEIAALQHRGEWAELTRMMIEAARKLEAGGAELVLICTNTMHKMADAVQEQLGVPLLHIADAVADRIREAGLSRIGLLGTKFTMEEPFYKDRLAWRQPLRVTVPDAAARETVHRVIYDELVRGIINPASKAAFQQIIGTMAAAGTQGIVLGCTEIPLLIKPEDVPVPLFDSTAIHAEKAVELALQ